jgi:hypothetical protein
MPPLQPDSGSLFFDGPLSLDPVPPGERISKPGAAERRDSHRFDLAPGKAQARVGGRGALELRDVSATGSSLLVPGDVALNGAALTALIELDGGEAFRAELEVVRVRPQQAGLVELGTRFGDLPGEALVKLSRFIARQHRERSADPARLTEGGTSLRVNNPLFIANLFSGRGAALFAVDGRARLPGDLLVDGLQFHDGQRTIRVRALGDEAACAHFALLRPYTFLLAGAGAVTVFEARFVSRQGTELLLELPREVRQTGFRESPRVALEAHAATAVAVDHPRLCGARIVSPLFDVAGRGMSFPVHADEHALFPGDRLSGLRVDLPDGAVEALGVVRSIASRGATDQLSCGVELVDFAGREDAHRWHRFVFRQTHPSLRDSHGRADSAWRVLDESKYIALWTPEGHRGRIKHHFMRAWQAPAPEVGHKMVLHRDQQAVGVSAGSVAYPGTWILHHLGIVPAGEGRDAQQAMQQASELIAGLLYRLRELGNLQHFVIYAERGKRWNDRLYGDFAARYADDGKLLCTPMQVYRRLAETPLPAATADQQEVEVALSNPRLWSALARHLQQTLPAAEVQAYGLGARDIDLCAFTQDCAGHGYERAREALFACVDGRPVAAMLVETGNEGVNVFGLLNSCRMFWLDPTVAGAAAIRGRLLREAVKYFRAAGKSTFLLLDSDGEETALPPALGFEAISPAQRLLAHRDVIPAWLAYLGGLLTTDARAAARAPAKEPSTPAPAPALAAQL